MNKTQAIRKHCFECCGDSVDSVTLCQIKECALWPFRTGALMRSRIYRARVEGLWKRGLAQIKAKKKGEPWKGEKPSAGELVEELLREGKDLAFLEIEDNPAMRQDSNLAGNEERDE